MPASNGPTAAGEWGGKQEPVELPSGNKAVLRDKINVWVLVRRGAMSQDMLDAFAKAADGVLEDVGLAVQLTDVILPEMFVDPPVYAPDPAGDDGQPDGSVHVDQIADEDVEFVLERAFRGAREAAAFRDEQRSGAARGDSAGVGGSSKPAAGPRGRRGGRVPAGQAAGGKGRSRAAAKPKS